MLFPFVINAQTATLDSKRVLSSLDVFKKIDTLMAKEQLKYSKEYEIKKSTLEKTIAYADSLKLEKPKDKKTKEVIQRSKELQQELVDFENESKEKLIEYKSLIATPYYEKVDAIIKKIAQKLNYKQVFDTQAISFVYIDPETDITEIVINELKKEFVNKK